MADKTKGMIHYRDAPVEYRTDIKGWVDGNGRFFGEDEHLARYSSSTVLDCSSDDCEDTVTKGCSIFCEECQTKNQVSKWESASRGEYISGWLYSELHGKYFDGKESAMEFAVESGLAAKGSNLDHMLLYMCKPNFASPICLDEHLESILPEDMYADEIVDSDILELVSALNEKLKRHAPISDTASDVVPIL